MKLFAVAALMTFCTTRSLPTLTTSADPRRTCQESRNPPCGPCDGIGGICWGDADDQCTYPTCEALAAPTKPYPPVFPSLFTAKLQGADRLPHELPGSLSPKPRYSNITSTWWYDFAKRELEHDTTYSHCPFSALHIGSCQRVLLHKNNSEYSWHGWAAMPCSCAREPMDRPIAGPDAFVGARFVGRVRITLEYEHKSWVLDHWLKQSFHIFVDAEPGSSTLGMPKRFFSPYSGFVVYRSIEIGASPSQFALPKTCLLCRPKNS